MELPFEEEELAVVAIKDLQLLKEFSLEKLL